MEFMYLVFTRMPEDISLVEFMYFVFTRMPEDVSLVEFMYPEFTCNPGESYRRRLRRLVLVLRIRALINSLVC